MIRPETERRITGDQLAVTVSESTQTGGTDAVREGKHGNERENNWPRGDLTGTLAGTEPGCSCSSSFLPPSPSELRLRSFSRAQTDLHFSQPDLTW